MAWIAPIYSLLALYTSRCTTHSGQAHAICMLARRKPHLLRACAASFVLFFVGYLLMSVAPNIWALVPSSIVRSMGSSVVWVYSTLLIQLRVPNDLQGRMMALEMAAYVVRSPPAMHFRSGGFFLNFGRGARWKLS